MKKLMYFLKDSATYRNIVCVLLATLFLFACTTTPKREVVLPDISHDPVDDGVKRPVPVYDSIPEFEQNRSEEDSSASDVTRSIEPPERSRTSGKAVNSLIDQALRQEQSGRLEKAAAVIERALRIEPRNPNLWHHLAVLRLKQGNYTLAESLAAKSSALAKDDWQLKEKNLEIVNQVRRRR